MKRAKESGCFFRKKRKAREEELKKNEDAILKFVYISSDAISPNEMRCTRLAVLAPVNEYRKLRKKQRLAKLEIMKKQMLKAI